MARTPRLDPSDVHGAAEVTLVLRLGEPSGLGWRSCWPLSGQTPNSSIGASGYVGQDVQASKGRKSRWSKKNVSELRRKLTKNRVVLAR